MHLVRTEISNVTELFKLLHQNFNGCEKQQTDANDEDRPFVHALNTAKQGLCTH